MVRFINNHFGTEMWVAEDRVNEYKAAGHRPAADPVPTEKVPEKEPQKEEAELKEEPKKKAVKKK